ncbi:MAG: HAD-IIB family hydrolase [bacterium]
MTESFRRSASDSGALLIFSDMDGSLLDHHTYSHAPADPVLLRLEDEGIPVIPCTSKTRAELAELREELNNRHPFIVENGAAVCIPAGYFAQMPDGCVSDKGWWIKSFSEPRCHWTALLEKIAATFEGQFRTFAESSVAEIMAMTGLDEARARAASEREYGEPVKWLGDDSRRDEFVTALRSEGANVLVGGRFIHVSGDCDKGKALHWLADQYRRENPEKSFSTMAIGDSGNDIAMLEAADHALIIRSPVQSPPTLQKKDNVILSTEFGPAGWAEGVTRVLDGL